MRKFKDSLRTRKFVMPAAHSCRENPRQHESENVDGNTRLTTNALVWPWALVSRLISSPFFSSLWCLNQGVSCLSGCRLVSHAKSRARGKSVESCTRAVSSYVTLTRKSCRMHLARVYSRYKIYGEISKNFKNIKTFKHLGKVIKIWKSILKKFAVWKK